MKIFCGFIDPITCLRLDADETGSDKHYWDYISKHKLGEIVFQDTVDDMEFGLTNDGCFYIKYDWPEHEPISDFSFLMEFIVKNIIFPMQRIFLYSSVKQIEPVNIFRGVIGTDGFPVKTIQDGRRSTGSFTVDRFHTRGEVNTFTGVMPLDQYTISNKFFIGMNYPQSSFHPVSNFKKSFEDCRLFYGQHPSVRIDLLSLFLSSATNASHREAFYFGIMFLETLLEIVLQGNEPAFLATTPSPTGGQKMARIRDRGYIPTATLFHTQSATVNQKRNRVFHDALYPVETDLWDLNNVIDDVLVNVFNFKACSNLGIRIKHV